jgi:hypothetical protein
LYGYQILRIQYSCGCEVFFKNSSHLSIPHQLWLSAILDAFFLKNANLTKFFSNPLVVRFPEIELKRKERKIKTKFFWTFLVGEGTPFWHMKINS